MKKQWLLIVVYLILFLLGPEMIRAEKGKIIEDLVILSQNETNFIINYQDSSKSGLDFTVRGISAACDPDGLFQSFRIDFNADTTNFFIPLTIFSRLLPLA
jgi:hypothetical protein